MAETELLGGEMDGFFGITHRLCVLGKEWVAAFGGPQPILHTCLYIRIDLGALSHGWKCKETKKKIYIYRKASFLCYLRITHVGQITASL